MSAVLPRMTKSSLREIVFRFGVWLKGLDGALEIAGGLAIWSVSPGWILRVVRSLTQDEIAEDPHDLVANYLRHAASHLSLSSEHFMAIYLFGHGVVKLFVVVALLRNKLWAYPVSMLVFVGFIVYQVYRFSIAPSAGLVALTIFDLVVIWIIWLEYRAVSLRNA